MNLLKFISVGLVLFLILGCPSDTTLKLDPAQGRIVDNAGSGISGVKVYSSFSAILNLWVQDSAESGSDGSYIVREGVPYIYDVGRGCGNEPTTTPMSNFYLIVVHPSYDTSIVLFLVEGGSRGWDEVIAKADTIYEGDELRYGAVGTTRTLPDIVLKK